MRDPDEERDDRDHERQVPDALAERGEPGDALAAGQDGIVVYHEIHPCAEKVSSIAAGRSAIAYETRARLTFASK